MKEEGETKEDAETNSGAETEGETKEEGEEDGEGRDGGGEDFCFDDGFLSFVGVCFGCFSNSLSLSCFTVVFFFLPLFCRLVFLL